MGYLRLARNGVVLAEIAVNRDPAGTVVAPGGNLTAAFNALPASGGTLLLQTGLYGSWTTPSGGKPVTIRASVGATPVFRQIQCSGSNLTFDGIRLDCEGQRPPNINAALFETGGNANITFRNGFIGNVRDQKGAVAGGQIEPTPLNIVFDNVTFDGITFQDGVHSEAIFSQAPGLVVRNCHFGNECGATGAIFLLRGDWWGQKPYGGWTFENNVFERQIADHGGIIWGNASGGGPITNAVIRGNDFQHPSSVPNTTAAYTFTNSVESCNRVAGQLTALSLPGITHEPCA